MFERLSEARGRPRKYCTGCTEQKPRPEGRRPKEFFCDGCHLSVSRRVRGGKSDAGRYCSRECYFAHLARVSSEVQALRRIARNAKRLAREADRPIRASHPCLTCGSSITGRSKFCSEACATKARDLRRKRAKQSDSYRRSKAKFRKSRKAKQRGVTVEPFDDQQILDRDKWRCWICGGVAPKSLRGTYDDLAPEVDHVVALANGGAHARWNVRCAHRSCNAAKADRGQMALI